jgi:hypothetical protein
MSRRKSQLCKRPSIFDRGRQTQPIHCLTALQQVRQVSRTSPPGWTPVYRTIYSCYTPLRDECNWIHCARGWQQACRFLKLRGGYELDSGAGRKSLRQRHLARLMPRCQSSRGSRCASTNVGLPPHSVAFIQRGGRSWSALPRRATIVGQRPSALTVSRAVPSFMGCGVGGSPPRSWTGGRAVECTSLENWRTRKGIESSNLSLSAFSSRRRARRRLWFYW